MTKGYFLNNTVFLQINKTNTSNFEVQGFVLVTALSLVLSTQFVLKNVFSINIFLTGRQDKFIKYRKIRA